MQKLKSIQEKYFFEWIFLCYILTAFQKTNNPKSQHK